MNTLFDFNSKKNSETTELDIEKLTFSEQFKRDDNVDKIVKILISEMRFNSSKRKTIKELVEKYIKSWITLGKFKKLDADIKKDDRYVNQYNNIILYNKKFVNVFQENIIKDLKENSSYLKDFNPFRDTLQNNKKMSEFLVEDYRNMAVQTDENIAFDFSKRSSLKNNQNGNSIPYYRTQVQKRHYDKEDIGSLHTGVERDNLVYKKYDLNELY